MQNELLEDTVKRKSDSFRKRFPKVLFFRSLTFMLGWRRESQVPKVSSSGEDGTTFFYQSELPYDGMDDPSSARGESPDKDELRCAHLSLNVGFDLQPLTFQSKQPLTFQSKQQFWRGIIAIK